MGNSIVIDTFTGNCSEGCCREKEEAEKHINVDTKFVIELAVLTSANLKLHGLLI
jgi:hypothetical protein